MIFVINRKLNMITKFILIEFFIIKFLRIKGTDDEKPPNFSLPIS